MPPVPTARLREPKRRYALANFFARLVKEKPLGFASGMVIVLLLLLAVFGGYVSPYPYNEIHLIDRLQGPSSKYLLGTDQAGRDLLSRLIFGARISVLVGLAVTTISIFISTLIGGVSGFVGGKLDLTVQRFVDAWNAFPGLLLLLTMMAIVGKGLLQIILVMGIAGGIGGARVIRGAVMGIKENVYFDVAEAIGSPTWRSLLRHVVPNITPVIIIVFSTSIGGVIMALASLGFLGFGPQHSRLGRHAQPGRAQVHGAGAAAGSVAGSVPDRCHLQPEHVRRRGAGPARSAAQGRRTLSTGL